MDGLENLSFSRFKAHYRVMSAMRLPPYAGSALHGALGHAMHGTRYGLRETCSACPIRSECRYQNLGAYFTESPSDHPFIKPVHASLHHRMQRDVYPGPLIFDLPERGDYEPGESLTLPFTLIGKAISLFPFVACALSVMGQRGLGPGRGRMVLEAITDGFEPSAGDERIIYDPDASRIDGPFTVVDFTCVNRSISESLNSGSHTRRIRIAFLTPFRYKSDGKLGEKLTFEVFIRSLFRRLTLLSVHSPADFHVDYGHLLSLARAVEVEESKLLWFEFPRYSGRQRKWLNLGGFVGETTFSGDLEPFLPFIKTGEFLNAGKAASFGHGKYALTILQDGTKETNLTETSPPSATPVDHRCFVQGGGTLAR